MKKLLALLLVVSGIVTELNAQLNKDSIMINQMNQFKSALKLSAQQFSDFKKTHVKFQSKAQTLTAKNFDSARMKQEFIILKKEMRNELKNILSDAQFNKYKERINQTIAAFKTESEKNKIRVFSVDADFD